MLVLSSSDARANPLKSLHQVAKFGGLDPSQFTRGLADELMHENIEVHEVWLGS